MVKEKRGNGATRAWMVAIACGLILPSLMLSQGAADSGADQS